MMIDELLLLRVWLAAILIFPSVFVFVIYLALQMVARKIFGWSISFHAIYIAAIIGGAWSNAELIINSWR